MVVPNVRDGEQIIYFRAGGEWCYLWTSKNFKIRETTPVVIQHHGARSYVREGAADWLDTECQADLLRAVMHGSDCAMAGSHACGDHWGDSCSVEANAALLRELDGIQGLDTSRLGLLGGGLGGALVWNSLLGPYAGRVRLVAVMQAVASLDAVIREKKFRRACLNAYGLQEEIPDDEAYRVIKPSDPLPKLEALRKGTMLPRTAIYHGAGDRNIPAETHAVPLAEALRKADGDIQLNIFAEVEHNVYEMGEPIKKRLGEFFSNL